MKPYEKLGAFYLGRSYNLEHKKIEDELILYDSRDLLTHAFCVGMTGSGKTGLCVTLLEEAAIDGIPALVIDPKGDLTNLLLTFPGLSGADFRPWINEDAANRKNMTPDAYAQSQAELWREGLASWNQTGERIQRLRDSAEFAIYTPGSEAGLPVSILDSFAAPPPAIQNDSDLFNERIGTTATSLLGLLGIDADPIKSREHILISTILEHAWRDGQDLDLAQLIQAIQSPPVSRIGILELETFYPAKDRFELAMALNNLLASPSFETWLSGEPLDIDRLLYSPSGKPRCSIFSIAHLSENERMFFVSLLLNQTLGWMRSRPGTTSLRAIVYMDEIFGYIPPVANPPSKKPLLTLLKQARAYGVGLVLATQNPVDLDYKGLSNTGTWFIGRLQTDRDKQRVIEGLEGVSAGKTDGFNRQKMEQAIAGLGERVFLMHNIHEDAPVVFHTRWAMSYLCGPMTRHQIKRVMEPIKAGRRAESPHDARPEETKVHRPTPTRAPLASPSVDSTVLSASRPVLPPDIPQVFLPVREIADEGIVYQPGLLGMANVHFVQTRSGIEHEEAFSLLAPMDEETVNVDWREAEEIDLSGDELEKRPESGAEFGPLPRKASTKGSYTSWSRAMADMLYRTKRLELFESARFKMVSHPGESERDFRIRLTDAAREGRDQHVDRLRKRYTSKFRTVEDQIRRAELAVEREQEQAKHQKLQTAISFGATMLSAFLGRKTVGRSTVGRATTAARGVGRSAKEAQDVGRAKTNVESLKRRLEDLQADFDAEIEKLEDRFDPELEKLDTLTLQPRKVDIEVSFFGLGWIPYRRNRDGSVSRAWS